MTNIPITHVALCKQSPATRLGITSTTLLVTTDFDRPVELASVRVDNVPLLLYADEIIPSTKSAWPMSDQSFHGQGRFGSGKTIKQKETGREKAVRRYEAKRNPNS